MREHGAWFLSQMSRWGYLRSPADGQAIVDGVYRPEYVQTVATNVRTRDDEHFCDGAKFDPTIALAAPSARLPLP